MSIDPWTVGQYMQGRRRGSARVALGDRYRSSCPLPPTTANLLMLKHWEDYQHRTASLGAGTKNVVRSGGQQTEATRKRSSPLPARRTRAPRDPRAPRGVRWGEQRPWCSDVGAGAFISGGDWPLTSAICNLLRPTGMARASRKRPRTEQPTATLDAGSRHELGQALQLLGGNLLELKFFLEELQRIAARLAVGRRASGGQPPGSAGATSKVAALEEELRLENTTVAQKLQRKAEFII